MGKCPHKVGGANWQRVWECDPSRIQADPTVKGLRDEVLSSYRLW